MDPETRAELERRIELIENGGDDGVLPPLPLVDLVAAVVGLALAACALLWWAL
ncbi:hypothetical protein HNR19_002892 [Nocardioides thalensis]|uniref:Uncharacterized protein n=1 Tax=Nocardioides thalensis TaxID=1914755 RepID=A0A853C433_9ACTN|nr:hypothetical protein [Nocardioides thalensis]NYJ02194.1 hypothetical protein [Nocardioides thalensis]